MEYRKVSIVIPVYNERSTIEELLEAVAKASTLGLEKEIILVDDCSTDGTTDFFNKLNLENSQILFHKKNQGKGAALHDGFAVATGDIVVVQDADLEYDPVEIEKIIKPFVESKAQVVYGSRYLKPEKKLAFWHSFFNQIFTDIGNIFIRQHLTDIMTCYKAFDREVLEKILPKLESQRFGFEPEVTAKISKLGYKIFEVPISYTPRSKEEGKHMNFFGQLESLWALFKYSIF